tara:strand:+ start:6536 stop:7840 length:1305 start_codon:yes stop_codon:yes gene_type:complete
MNSKHIYKIFLFLFIFYLIFNFLEILLVQKRPHAKKWSYIYNNNTNIDILFMGSSHTYTGINPNVLDDLIGLESFILGSASQNIIQTYFNLVEVLKYKNPKLIIIGLNSIITNKEKTKLGYYYENLDGMKLTINKYQSIKNTLDSKYYVEAFLPLAREHFNWKDLKDINTKYLRTHFKNEAYTNKGHNALEPIFTQNDFLESIKKRKENDKSYLVNNENLDYLQKISFLCRKNDIQLLVFKTPTLREIDLNTNLDILINHYSEESNFLYLNLGHFFTDLRLNYLDFYDSGHLSKTGAKKVTKHLAHFLIENYSDRLDINLNYNDMLSKYEQQEKENLKNSLEIKSLEINEDEKVIHFIVNTYNSNVSYAFYLYKNGEKIDYQIYSDKNYYELLKPKDNSIYKIKYFIVPNFIKEKTKSKNKNSGFFKEFQLNEL